MKTCRTAELCYYNQEGNPQAVHEASSHGTFCTVFFFVLVLICIFTDHSPAHLS